MKVLVAGAGGFIGGHLVSSLLEQGFQVQGIDIKPLKDWYQVHPEAVNLSADLSILDNCNEATKNMSAVYNLAADMGGMGFIENNKAACMLSVLINTHLLIAAKTNKVQKYFFASSACVYAASKQEDPNNFGLKESDAYPAMPEDGYGWEKLFSERMCRHFSEDFGLEVRIARFHNVYGPHGTYDGGREKAPAAICRKVANAVLENQSEIQIWGDGEQTRSFTFIDDCIIGINRLMESSHTDPINLGSSEMVSINQLVSIIEDIEGIKLNRIYDLSAPQGVRGRNSDNTEILRLFNWEPDTSLRQGLSETYKWIKSEISVLRRS